MHLIEFIENLILAPSSFGPLSALCWNAFVQSKGFASGADTYLMFTADLRTRLDPPVGECYLGNCVSSCLTITDAGQLPVPASVGVGAPASGEGDPGSSRGDGGSAAARNSTVDPAQLGRLN
jgi:hypothetical protein